MEVFVRSRRVGADAWRRTGVLTFDGNIKTGPKVTFKRIQQHIQEKYGTNIGCGTGVQLCTIKNKCRLSAKKKDSSKNNVSNTKDRFSLRMKEDAHWSDAVYQRLDE